LEGIYQDSLAFEDSLPTPPPVLDPDECREMMVSVLRNWLPEEKAREVAAEPEPSDEDWLRAQALEMGASPEETEQVVALWRRQGKWIAVSDAAEPAEAEVKAEARKKELRTVAPQISKLAAKAAQVLPGLLVTPGNAATVRDQVLLSLFRVLEDARLVADSVPRATWIADEISRGEELPTADEVVLAAHGLVPSVRNFATDR
jgi:hypothetical protein